MASCLSGFVVEKRNNNKLNITIMMSEQELETLKNDMQNSFLQGVKEVISELTTIENDTLL